MSDFPARDFPASNPYNYPSVVSGSYYRTPGVFIADRQWGLQYECCYIMQFSPGAKFDRIGVSVKTAGAAGAVGRLGIRPVLTDGTPGAPAVDVTVATDVVATVEAVIDFTAIQAFYYVSYTPQVASPDASVLSMTISSPTQLASDPSAPVTTTFQTLGVYSLNNRSGALPQAFGGSYVMDAVPAIHLRAK